MSTPAGWYPDPAGATGTRWWDGAQWTQHTQAAPVQQPRPAVPRYGEYAPVAPAAPIAPAPANFAPNAPAAPAEVPTNTVWIWLAIAASVVPFFTLFALDWDAFLDIMRRAATSGAPSPDLVAWQMNSLWVSLLSWAALAAVIVFSWLDWRELKNRGVVRPFHWAWAFFALISLGVAVYMIGRAVVLGTRTVQGGRAPLWAWIVATVVGYVVIFSWMFWFIGQVFAVISQTTLYS